VAVFNFPALFSNWWSPATRPDGRSAAKLSGGERNISPEQLPVIVATPDLAMQLGAVWACVRLLSETIGTLPLGVYRKDLQGRRDSASDLAIYGLLHDSPNADQTSAEFWEAVVANICLAGNAYGHKVRAGDGRLIAINMMGVADVRVYRDELGSRRYLWSQRPGESLSEDEVFHVRGFGVGGDIGLSPISYARHSLTAARSANDASSHAMQAGVSGAGFLVVPGKPTPEQRADIRAAYLEPITGAGNAGRAGLLEQGMDWKPVTGLPPEDMQLLETRAFHVEELCRWFRVPPFMIGHSEKSTSWGTGLEQQTIGFLTYALRPYLTRIEQAVKKQLLSAADRAAGVYAEFNLEGLMRADSTGRAALYSSAAQNGWMNRDEIRTRENLPTAPGGDLLTVQSNLVPLHQLEERGGAPTPPGFGQPAPAAKPEPTTPDKA
jgi:HK97 family phage portal protein